MNMKIMMVIKNNDDGDHDVIKKIKMMMVMIMMVMKMMESIFSIYQKPDNISRKFQ